MSSSRVIVEYDHLPQFETKMVLAGKAITKEILDKIADDIEAQGPYREQIRATVKILGGLGSVNVEPWWIGFIELGTVDRAARPFAGPIAERVFATLIPKMKLAGSKL